MKDPKDYFEKDNKLPEIALQDGVTHINIYMSGRTQLGKMMSNFYPIPLIHPVFGYFASMESFWYWLSTGKKHEALRNLYGINAKQAGRQFGREEVPDFVQLIKDATTIKVLQSVSLQIMLNESFLPFDHYYILNNTYVAQPHFMWQVEHWEEIRNRIKSGNTLIDQGSSLEEALNTADPKQQQIVNNSWQLTTGRGGLMMG